MAESPNAKRTSVAVWKPSELTADLQAKIPAIDEVLPECVRGEGARLVKRAFLTITQGTQRDMMAKCTMSSIVYGVLQAAEIGLPIDGKLAYLVPYWNKHKGVFEAQCQPSYLGLTLVAKRSGQILDLFPAMVHANDIFEHYRSGHKCHLEHSWNVTDDRGEPVAAYCVVELPGSDRWTYEIMTIDEINAIRERSKAKDSGPWVTDYEQMCLKTVCKRASKRYCTDPGFVMATQVDDEEYIVDDVVKPERQKRATKSAAGERFITSDEEVEEAVEKGFNDDPQAELDAALEKEAKVQAEKHQGTLLDKNDNVPF